ncbi:hypothetical protein LJC61_02685 [Ruminococcaceae bacterium OttesenSCG-928-A16]|nr:hypothetical protein [Ruminococcaceae bacterium OttesenSCG-928-A16]
MDKICGTCEYHTYDPASGDWLCFCDKSDFFTDWTGYNDGCPDWEER